MQNVAVGVANVCQTAKFISSLPDSNGASGANGHFVAKCVALIRISVSEIALASVWTELISLQLIFVQKETLQKLQTVIQSHVKDASNRC